MVNPINKKIPKYLQIPFADKYYFLYFRSQKEYEDWQKFSKVEGLTTDADLKFEPSLAYMESAVFEDVAVVSSLVFVKKPTIPILVHELSHQVDHFIKTFKFDAEYSGTELRSVLLEWLTREALEFYKL